jgi:ribose transport system substrate-binding protein
MDWRSGQIVTRREAIAAVSFYWATWAIATRAMAAQKTFGVVLPPNNIEYYVAIFRGVQQEATLLGNIEIIEGHYNDLAELIKNVQDLVSRKVDGLLIVLEHYDSQIGMALNFASSAGIPIVTVEGKLQGASATVVPDFEKAAQLQAQIAAKFGSAAGPYVYVAGPKNEVNSILQGSFDKSIKGQVDNINLDSYSPEEIINKMSNVISKEPSVAAIAASTDFIALNTILAAKKVGKDISIIGLGATSEGLEAVKNGEMVATIDLKPEEQGSQALQLLNSIAQTGVCPTNGQKPPCPPKSITPAVIANQEK